jgi:extracellular elastinolytic metalloproteinase
VRYNKLFKSLSFYILFFFVFVLSNSTTLLGQNPANDIFNRKYKNIGSNYRISSQHLSKQSGILHTYYVQTLNGLDIINSVASLHMKGDELIKENNGLEPRFFNYAISSQAGFSFTEVARRYAENKSINLTVKTTVEAGSSRSNQVNLINSSLSSEPIPTQLAYAIVGKELRLIYRMQLWRDRKMTDVWLDALNGQLVKEVSMTTDCGFAHSLGTEHNCSKNTTLEEDPIVNSSMTGSYKVFPIGQESPLFGTRQIVNNPSDINASPFGWHDTNGSAGPEFTTTQGNNVDTKDDLNGDNEASSGARPDGTSTLVFDYPWSDTVSLIASVKNASSTNLFYWNNIVHDVTYQYGFDEAAGNFQMNNYGKGGIGNDAVFADDLDGSGINNADFSAPADGSRPRMQMFEWLTPSNLIIQPSSLFGSKTVAVADFGPEFYNLTDSLIVATPNDGCSTITNNVAGKIAIIDRGTCNFSLKVYNAQLAGAVGVIVVQNEAANPFIMGKGTNFQLVNIPSQMITQNDGNAIKSALSTNTVVVTSISNKITNSSMDNGIVAHEYGHGISTRLTGGAANSSCLNNAEQMGEGWSDWLALMLTMKGSHTAIKPRGIGNYVLGNDTLGRGIRAYRYSRDMGINPFTYSYIFNQESEHYIGSVWASMIWDLTWDLIDKYGYSNDIYYGTKGNNIAMQLIIEGMKLQPCSPGFVDGRNAILLADQLLYNGTNQCLIWKAFARRGLGFSADQGSSEYTNDGTQAFDLPSTCNELVLSISSDRPAASVNDSVAFTIKIKNLKSSSINNIIVKDTIPSHYQILSVSNTATVVDSIVTFPTFTLNGSDSTLRYIFTKLIDTTKVLSLIEDKVESANGIFTPINSTKIFPPFIKSAISPFEGSLHWFAKNDTSRVEKYLLLSDPIIPTPSTKLSFWHKYDTEAVWDGGQVQYSFDKNVWEDLGSRMIAGGYNSFIDNDPSIPAFSGFTGSYINTVINLGDFENKIVYIRFRMYCDGFVGGDGWYIDDISISSTKNLINNIACQSNAITNPSCVSLSLPIRAVPCTDIYSKDDLVQGSLRRAISCSNNNDTISIVGGLSIPELKVDGSSITINKNLTIGSWDQVMNIVSNQPGNLFQILPNNNVTFQNLNIIKPNTLPQTVILNGGNLIIKNVQVNH